VISGKTTHLLGNLARQKVIVGVEILQPFALCKFKQPIASDIAASIGAGFPMDPIAEGANHAQATVCRAIVDDNHFLVGPRLREGALYALSDPALGVVAGN
jgi:hypothetical protein